MGGEILLANRQRINWYMKMNNSAHAIVSYSVQTNGTVSSAAQRTRDARHFGWGMSLSGAETNRLTGDVRRGEESGLDPVET